MAFSIRFNEEKNQLLKATRGIGFEDVIKRIKNGKLLDNIPSLSTKHVNQRVYIIEINGYVYSVPYVVNEEKMEIFLKTIYPSRVLRRKYMEGGKDEKK